MPMLVPLPPSHTNGNQPDTYTMGDQEQPEPWTRASQIITCCFPAGLLSALGLHGSSVQQAWREKVPCLTQISLCLAIVSLMAVVGYFTIGLASSICPRSTTDTAFLFDSNSLAVQTGSSVSGFVYSAQDLGRALQMSAVWPDWAGQDLGPYLASPSCDGILASFEPCQLIPDANACVPRGVLNRLGRKSRISVEWSEIASNTRPPHMLLSFNNVVLNLTTLVQAMQTQTPLGLSSNLQSLILKRIGTDATLSLSAAAGGMAAMKCLQERYTVGFVGTQTLGCTLYNALETIALVAIAGLIFTRFFLAFMFHWLVSPRISRPITTKLRADMPPEISFTNSSFNQSVGKDSPFASVGHSVPLPSDLHTICLVTCYSESSKALKATLDSISASDYPVERKLLFVICDGLVLGEGNTKSTPDLVLDMIQQDLDLGVPEPKSYLAIADGTKQHNMAQVVRLNLLSLQAPTTTGKGAFP